MKKNFKEVEQDNYSHDVGEFNSHTNFYHPPLLPMPDIPVGLHYGSFLCKRRFDVHTGVDLYTKPDSKVYAVEAGEVVSIRPFTGKDAECDWWNPTEAIEIEGFTGTLCYGEVKPVSTLKVGDYVKAGEVIGNVVQVLKVYKGKAMSMLHFAIHSHAWRHLEKVIFGN